MVFVSINNEYKFYIIMKITTKSYVLLKCTLFTMKILTVLKNGVKKS